MHYAVVIGSGSTAPVLIVKSTESALDVLAQTALAHTIIAEQAIGPPTQWLELL